MTDHSERTDPKQVLDSKIRRSGRALLAERVYPRIWPPVAIVLLFIICTMAGLWQWATPQIHLAGLIGFGLALLVSFIPLIRVRGASRDEALKRLEQTSRLPHRPASSYEDDVASIADAGSSAKANTASGAIWQEHRSRLAKMFNGLRVGSPRPRIDRRDPFGLRALLVLGAFAAMFMTGQDGRDRLASAFTIKPEKFVSLARLDAWATPPVYTGKPPVLLSDGSRMPSRDVETKVKPKRFEVPQKSIVTIRVSAPDEETTRSFTVEQLNPDAEKSANVKPVTTQPDAKLREFKIALEGSTTITIREGGETLQTFEFAVTPDAKPVIALKSQPTPSARNALQLEFTVEDDYGVASAEARFKLDRTEQGEIDADELKRIELAMKALKFDAPHMALRLPRLNPKKAEGRAFQDLTAHPWAGLPVEMTLAAKDQAGQEGTHGPVKLRLPARTFSKLFARAVVEQRSKLVFNPTERKGVIEALDALTIAPEIFIRNAGIYLGLRSARSKLANDHKLPVVREVVDQLWAIALKIEEGDLSDAERRLRDAQDKLAKALKNGATPEEIERLMKELRQAMNQFLRELSKQAQRNGQQPQQNNPNSQQQTMTSRDLEKMLKQIEQMAKSGSREMAQQMLDKFRQMMEQLQAGKPQQGNGQANQMMQKLEKFGELIQEQQRLLDDTFRRQRGDQPRQQQGQRPGQRQGQQQGQQGQQRQGQNGQRGQRPEQRGQQGGQRGQQQGQQGQGRGQQGRQPGGQGQGNQPGLGQRQAELQQRLQQLLQDMQGLGAQTPGELREAERSMGRAGDALRQDQLGRATEREGKALEQLRKGTQSLAEQILKNMQSQMANQQGQRGRRDPMGRARSNTGPDLGTSVKVPDQIDMQRAREILQELRRRLSDPNRPSIELDYIERLLRRF